MKKIITPLLICLFSLKLAAQSWSPVSIGVTNPTTFMSAYKNVFLALTYSKFTSTLEQWDGSSWTPFNGGNTSTALLIQSDSILAGGRFTGSTDNRMMSIYDGTSWKPFGTSNSYGNVHWNTNYQYTNIFKYNSNLNILAGEGLMKFDLPTQKFIKAGDQLTDIGREFNVTQPCIMNNKAYMCGNYFMGIGVKALVWNDTKWDTLNMNAYTSPTGYGSGLENMTSYKNEIYFSGIFQKGSTYYSLLKYDGNSITEVLTYVSPVLSNKIVRFFPTPNYLFVQYKQNNITYVGYISQNKIIQIGVATGTENIFSMVDYKNEVYVGGDFTSIGGISANYIAKTSLTSNVKETKYLRTNFSIYPTPATTELNISGPEKISHIEIYNLTGVMQSANLNKNTIDVSAFNSGVYFIKVYSENGVSTQKFIKQ